MSWLLWALVVALLAYLMARLWLKASVLDSVLGALFVFAAVALGFALPVGP